MSTNTSQINCNAIVDHAWFRLLTADLLHKTLLPPPTSIPTRLIDNPGAVLQWRRNAEWKKRERLEASIALLCGCKTATQMRVLADAVVPAHIFTPLETQSVRAWDARIKQFEQDTPGLKRRIRMKYTRACVRRYLDERGFRARLICAALDEEALELLLFCYQEDERDVPGWLQEFVAHKRERCNK